MPQEYYVVEGATLACSAGSASSHLKVTSQSFEKIDDKLQATNMDFKPNENILPFGTCSVTKNGCAPATKLWDKVSAFVDNDTNDEILKSSTCQCAVGGLITVKDAGQYVIVESTSTDDESGIEVAVPEECHCEEAPWMKFVLEQLNKGIEEAPGKRSPEIMKYYANTPFQDNKKITDSNNSWCASFVNWIMVQAGYEQLTSKDPYDKTRALKWQEWQQGRIIPKPVYGALAIKARKGGGHIGFVAGKKKVGETEKLAVIGGNQGNSLCAAYYDQKDFRAFVVPADYDLCKQCYELPEYNGNASKAKSES